MTPSELAAYIGAAAWLPQIATWLYGYFAKATIRVIPDAYAEVGFTTWGPIFNVRMAITAERRAAIIDGFELVLNHSDGETRRFRWSGLKETFSELRDDAGNALQTMTRDQTPIALKVGTESLVEKLVRFQEPRYHETDGPLFQALVAHFNFLKRSGDPEYVTKVLASKEVYDLNEARTNGFWWRPGRYDVTIVLSSPKKVTLEKPNFHFTLTANDVDQLRQNLDALRVELENVLNSNLPDFQAKPFIWNWANVTVTRGG